MNQIKSRFVLVFVLFMTLVGCGAIANKNDSWIGHSWKEYNERSVRGECYPAGQGIVSCYLQDWTVDSNGIITGWRSNSR
jgi:hypothetical protein